MITKPTDYWIQNLLGAAEELGTDALAFEDPMEVEPANSPPIESMTSCVAMLGDQNSIQLGVAASQEHCNIMVRSMLGMEDDEGPLSESDLSDAFGEIVNILAGSLKTRVDSTESTMVLGLPIVLWGRIEVPSNMEMGAALVRWGAVEATLFVLKKHQNGEKK